MDSGNGLPLLSGELESDSKRLDDYSDPSLVMAEQNSRDVVVQAQSVGDLSSSDVPAKTQFDHASGGDEGSIPDTTTISGRQTNDNTGIFSDARINGESLLQEDINGDTIPSGKQDLTYKNPHIRNAQQFAVNGEHTIGSQLLGDASGGSDTDTSRADGSFPADVGRQDDRRDSVKKPFKPVSFAKFSVNKSASSTPTPKMSSDKVPPLVASSIASNQLSSKPRLVARTTGTLRDAAPKSLKSGGKGGPDPSQVWNKNRPTAPPSTKHLTDEELKQQYGIHLTSRIQADGEGKEAKWADIDDDEDDWAPETIEWNDGTKITLAPSDNIAAPKQDVKAMPGAAERSKDIRPTKPKTPTITSTVGPNATVLKIGAQAERQQQQAKLAASQQKVPSEKPLLPSAKTPAPVPAKSPWASLPPVDKASPVVISPQLSNVPPQHLPRNVQGPTLPGSSTASPAKEISADDFNRSWRQDQDVHPRELFMPNSGRYETVQDGRRRPSRNDQNFRAPAVLQRPSQTGQVGPAEPSAAFQTHRISTDQDRASWGRRRASSNVSGGSGPFSRRMSTSRHLDSPVFTDTTSHGPDGPERDAASSRGGKAPGAIVASPGEEPFSSNVEQPSPNNALSNDIVAQSSVPAPPNEAEVEAQKRMMKEKVAEARKRREEEEAKELAERRERIRLKMESLGMEPLNEEVNSKAAPPPQKSPASADIALQATSPPKPPVPEASGEPKQYGMMKVHHPETVKKFVSGSEKLMDKSTQALPKRNSEPLQRQSQELQSEYPSSEVIHRPDISSSGSQVDTLVQKGNVDNTEASANKAGGDEPSPGWNTSRFNQRYTPSLWGPPSNNKALGNGTFDQSMAAFAPRDLPRNSASTMDQPTLESKWTGRNKALGPRSPQLPIVQATVPDVGSTRREPSPEQRPVAANSEADSARPMSRPAPIGPPQQQRWQPSPVLRSPNPNLAAWNNFGKVAAAEDKADHERFRKEQATRAEEEARTGVRQIPQMNFNETFRQVEIGDVAGQRQVVGVSKTSAAPNQFQPAQFGTMTSFPAAPSQGLPSHGRNSRFFVSQQMNSDMTQALQSNFHGSNQVSSSSPPPPPAEEVGGFHPLYNSIDRPRVSFPAPKAVVKLPPAAPPTPPTPPPPPKPQPMTFASVVSSTPPQQVISPKPPAQTNANPPDWQIRFNELLGKKTIAEKKLSLPVTALSKDPLDHSTVFTSASVSLPQRDDEAAKGNGEMWSGKFNDEEAMFEDRVAGSLPTVKVVSRQFPHNWHAARIPHKGPKARAVRPVESLGSNAFTVHDLDPASRSKELTILVHIPGSNETKSKVISRKGAHQPSSKGPRHASGVQKAYRKGGPKSKESSGSYAASSNSNTKTAGNGTTNANISSSRGQSSGNWGRPRQASAVVH
ncbi:MAG: hypothetical protein Q9160_003444 [Pyrenula sp. 1 TL-2023]